MKRAIVFILAAMLLLSVSSVSFGQSPTENTLPMRGFQGREITPENFNQVKSDILQRMAERMKRITEEKACVEAASNPDELKKCMPGGPPQKRMQQPPK